MLTEVDSCRRAAQEALLPRASVLGLELDPREIDVFSCYCALLLSANEQFNLTAISDPAEVMRLHFLDSISALPPLDALATAEFSLCDVGTGGGLPGLAIAALRPGWQITLLDSIAKKTRFVQHAAESLGLNNVVVVTDRAERFGRDSGRDRFDVCLARAVAATSTAVELCAPLVRAGGVVILYKKGDVVAECAEANRVAPALGCNPASYWRVPADLGLGSDRFLITLAKSQPTPERFPRRVGVARSRPL